MQQIKRLAPSEVLRLVDVWTNKMVSEGVDRGSFTMGLHNANEALKEWFCSDSDLRRREPQYWVQSVNCSLQRMLLGGGLATVVSCFMTFGLWVSRGFNGRGLPNVPLLDVVDFNGMYSHELSSLTTALLLPSLLLLAYKYSDNITYLPTASRLLWAQILMTVVVVCMDVWRMQTWLYIFTTICFVINVYHPQLLTSGVSLSSAIPSEDLYSAITLCRVITCSVWMHSGLLKFNPNYPYGDFAMMVPLFERIPSALVLPLAYGSAAFETALGLVPLLIIFWSSRTNGTCMEQDTLLSTGLRLAWLLVPVAASGMHLFICIRLFYQHYELGVIPWNFAFLCYTYYLFVRIRSPFPVLKPQRKALGTRGRSMKGFTCAAVVMLYVVLPLLAAVNCYHCYLSFSMYTTNDPALLIFTPLSDNLLRILPRNNRIVDSNTPVHRFRSCGIELQHSVPLYYTHNWDWGFADTGASLYPSFWSYEQLARKTCEMTTPTHEPITFIIVEKLAFPYWYPQHYYELICAQGKLHIAEPTPCKT